MGTELDRFITAARLLNGAANRLKLRITSPYFFPDCKESKALAYFPDLGSPRGAVVDSIEPPLYEGNKDLHRIAEASQVFYSQVNIAEMTKYSDADFIAMFCDWGFYGDSPPPWFDGTRSS